MGWTKEVYLLPKGHGWSARPGHEILVLDAGAVVLEFPEGWFVGPGAGHVEIRDGADREASTCVLAVSYLRLPDRDWSDLPLSYLLVGFGSRRGPCVIEDPMMGGMHVCDPPALRVARPAQWTRRGGPGSFPPEAALGR